MQANSPNVGQRVPPVPEEFVVLLQVTDAALFRLHFGGNCSGGGSSGGGSGGFGGSDLIRRRSGGSGGSDGCGNSVGDGVIRRSAASVRRGASGVGYALGAQVLFTFPVAGGRRGRRDRGRLGPGRGGCRRAERERGGGRAAGRLPDDQRARTAGRRTIVVGQRRRWLFVVLFLFDVVQRLLFAAGHVRLLLLFVGHL